LRGLTEFVHVLNPWYLIYLENSLGKKEFGSVVSGSLEKIEVLLSLNERCPMICR
jgi:hypothetical protein